MFIHLIFCLICFKKYLIVKLNFLIIILININLAKFKKKYKSYRSVTFEFITTYLKTFRARFENQ